MMEYVPGVNRYKQHTEVNIYRDIVFTDKREYLRQLMGIVSILYIHVYIHPTSHINDTEPHCLLKTSWYPQIHLLIIIVPFETVSVSGKKS